VKSLLCLSFTSSLELVQQSVFLLLRATTFSARKQKQRQQKEKEKQNSSPSLRPKKSVQESSRENSGCRQKSKSQEKNNETCMRKVPRRDAIASFAPRLVHSIVNDSDFRRLKRPQNPSPPRLLHSISNSDLRFLKRQQAISLLLSQEGLGFGALSLSSSRGLGFGALSFSQSLSGSRD